MEVAQAALAILYIIGSIFVTAFVLVARALDLKLHHFGIDELARGANHELWCGGGLQIRRRAEYYRQGLKRALSKWVDRMGVVLSPE